MNQLNNLESLHKRAKATIDDLHPTPEHIMQIDLGFWASKRLLSAVEVGLFTELARKPESLETVQDRVGLHPRSARDFLDTLVALGSTAISDRRHGSPMAW